MTSTGVVRKIDELGRIALPSELRRVFSLREGDELEISVEGERVILNNGKMSVCSARPRTSSLDYAIVGFVKTVPLNSQRAYRAKFGSTKRHMFHIDLPRVSRCEMRFVSRLQGASPKRETKTVSASDSKHYERAGLLLRKAREVMEREG